jgi:hypothetical protein
MDEMFVRLDDEPDGHIVPPFDLYLATFLKEPAKNHRLWSFEHSLCLSHCPYRSESGEVTLNTLSLPLSVPSGVKGGFILPLLYVIIIISAVVSM